MSADASQADIRIAFARFEGSVSADLKNLVHDMKNFSMKIETFATLRDLEATGARVEKLEKNQVWITRTVVASVVSAVMGVAGYVALGAKVLH